jgi:hypothetical protein
MSKKIYLLPLLLCVTLPAWCQLKKGQWVTGGTAAYAHSTTKGTTSGIKNTNKVTSFQAAPLGGYFFMDRFCAGLRPGYSTSSTNQVLDGAQLPMMLFYSSTTSKSTAFSIAPFARYYFLPAGRKINILADLSYAYDYVSQHSETYQRYNNLSTQQIQEGRSTSVSKEHASSYTLAAGPAIFFNPKVSLELTVGYSITDFADSDLTSNTIQVGTGFLYFFGK